MSAETCQRARSITLGVVVGLVTMSLSAAAPARAATARTSLLSGVQSTFDGSIGTWSCLGTCRLREVRSPVHTGTGSLELEQTTPNQTSEWLAASSQPAKSVPASPGFIYAAGAWVRASTNGRALAPFLVFFNRAGTRLASVFGSATVDGPTWTRSATVTGIAPNGTSRVVPGFVFGGGLAGERHFVDDAFLVRYAGGSSPVAGPFRTAGKSIVDARGRRVVFRGLVRAGTEIDTSSFPTESEIANAKAWGANFVRVPLGEQLWLNTCTSFDPSNDPAYPRLVDTEVASITRRGMMALLDLHFNVLTPCGKASQHTMADAPYSVSFWKEVAHRYAQNPLVAFDLYNEPHDISDAVWRNGGAITEGAITYTAAGMQQLYSAVRSQGAGNLVFVSGNDWADAPSSAPVSGFNVVNAVHTYTCPHNPPPNCLTPDPRDPTSLLRPWAAVGDSSPVIVTEFGWPIPTEDGYNGAVIAYAESHGWGWAAFAWDGTTSGQFNLLADAKNYEPIQAGEPVLAGLHENP